MSHEPTPESVIDLYRKSFLANPGKPEAIHSSPEGQIMRFEKLLEIGELSNASLLDIGCGQGDFYEFLEQRSIATTYHGVDVVPEMIAYAKGKFPAAQFEKRDILAEGFEGEFDFVTLCGVFNIFVPNCEDFMRKMLVEAFRHCKKSMGFNFLSTYVTYTTEGVTYHDPAEILKFCIENLSRKVELHHHYGRADVAVFVHR